MSAKTSLLLLLVVLSPAATPAVYRCVGEQGEPAFSQRPCARSGDTLLIDSPGHESGAAQGLRQSERDWLARRKAGRGKAKAVRRGRAEKKSRDVQRRQAYQCQRKRHALDALEAEMRRGYKASREVTLRRRMQKYRDYLSAFCG